MKMTAEREEVIDFIAPYYDQTGILIGISRWNIYYILYKHKRAGVFFDYL